jgi:hypothetical protein
MQRAAATTQMYAASIRTVAVVVRLVLYQHAAALAVGRRRPHGGRRR